MIIQKDILYKFFLLLVFTIPIAISSIEVTLVMCAFMLIFLLLDIRFKYSNSVVNTLTPLFLIFSIATISTFFYSREWYDIIKDIAYLIKPILFIILGYYLTSKIKDKDFIFKTIFYLAALFAAYHILEIAMYFFKNQLSISLIRYVGGKANYIELFAIVLLHVGKNTLPMKKPIKFAFLIRILLYISFVLYFSRTMLVAFFILFLAIKGYTKLTRKGVIYLTIFISLVLLFFASLQTMELDRSSKGLEGFLYKLQIAPSEIFSADVDINNHAQLWDHWRGYEAHKAFEQLDEANYKYGYFFGKGLGSLVDLGFEAPLSEGGIQYIPIIHNGFAYIMFKAGFVGMFIYLLFLAYLYLTAYHKKTNSSIVFFNNFISGISLFYLFTTLIITGVYNQGDVVTLILGSFLFLKFYYNKQSQISL